MPPLRVLVLSIFAFAAAASLCGCESDKAQAVTAQDFYARRDPSPSPVAGLDQSGALTNLSDARSQTPPSPTQHPSVRNGDLSDTDDDNDDMDDFPLVPAPPSTMPAPTNPAASNPPSTQPIAAAPAPSTQPLPDAAPSDAYADEDQYMTLGGVVAVVNNTPIYANKVVRLITPILRQYARQYDPSDYESNARQAIEEQISTLTNDELEVAAAERSLDPKDIQMAWALAHAWREKQIDEAGGSEQLARLRAQQSPDGEDFEDQEQDEYRHDLWLLYRYHKINPDIVFTDEDERRYFRDHADEFSTQPKATVLILEGDPDHLNRDPDDVRKSLQDIRKQVLQGKDFAAFARTQNDFPGAEGDGGNGGLMADLKPGSLVFTNVDAAIWKVPVGQVSDVIADSDAFFLIKVLSRDDGITRNFSDPKVQDFIRMRLTDARISSERENAIQKLELEGIAPPPSQDMIDIATDIAMDDYWKWSKEKP